MLCWYIEHDLTVWYPIDVVCEYIIKGASSINVKDTDRLLSEGKCIVLEGKKKRVYFKYDMTKFLEELYENHY